MSVDQQYDRACLLAKQQRYDLAVQEGLKMLAQSPDSDRAYNILAFCYARQQRPEEALTAANQAIALAPSQSFNVYRLADVHHKAKSSALAAEAIASALAMEPTKAIYCSLAASIAYQQGKTAEALQFAERGLQSDAEEADCLTLRVIALLDLHRTKEAEEEVLRVLQRYPERAVPHTARGWAALYRSKPAIASEAFKTALGIDPNSEWARIGMLEALKARNPIYRVILRYERWQDNLWRSKIKAFWVVLLAIPHLRGLYGIVIGLSMLIRCLFDVALRFHPYGALLFNAKEKWLNNCALITWGLVALGFTLAVKLDQPVYIGMAAAMGAIAYSTCLAWYCPTPKKKRIYIGIAGLASLTTLLFLMRLLPFVPLEIGLASAELASFLTILLVVGIIVAWMQR
jgi:tetratricopeptide (TPR) repeat protein